MATQTPNYKLIKQGQEDYYNVDILNGNMDLIDTALKEQGETIGEVSSQLAAITTLYTSNTGNDSYEITINGISSQADLLGKIIKFTSPTANTTSCTLNVNGYGAYAICKDISAALETGDILANSVVTVVWDGTRYQVLELNGVVTKAGTQTLTNKTFTTPKMTSGTSINDSNGNELIKFPTAVTSAVNEITVSNAITGNAPSFQASGGDTNVGMDFKSKGTGLIRHYINGVISVVFNAVASAVNYLTFKSNVTGSAPTVEATGSDTNIDINLVPKGTGRVKQNGTNMVLAGEEYSPNILINGNFDVWQRGTTQTTTGYGSADRWRNENNITTKTASRQAFTVGQTEVPNNPTYFFRTVVNSVAGSSAGSSMSQFIEDVTRLAGRTVTLTFWGKADSTKNMTVEFAQSFGAGGSATVWGIGINKITLSTTWTKYSITVTLPSISGKTVGTSHLTAMYFWFDAGSDFNARNNNLGQQSGTFDIAQVKLEFGNHATPFIPRSYGEELINCQRYYQTTYRNGTPKGTIATAGQITDTNANVSTNYYTLFIIFPVEMRVPPATSVYSPLSGTGGKIVAGGIDKDVLLSADNNNMRIQVNNQTIPANENVYGHYVLDAEL